MFAENNVFTVTIQYRDETTDTEGEHTAYERYNSRGGGRAGDGKRGSVPSIDDPP